MKTEKQIRERLRELDSWFACAGRISLYTEAERVKDRIESLKWVLDEETQ